MTLDQGHGRIEWRGIETKETEPGQMLFPHAAQVARVDRIRALRNGKQEIETVWIITSLTKEEATPERLLELLRLYWTIENGTHLPLDVSAGEDRCRVRHPVSATVLGVLRRAVQGEYHLWRRRQKRKRDRSFPAFRDRLSRRIQTVTRFTTGELSQL